MFGTLQCNIQRKDDLKFIENSDRAQAFSRSQRDKPHTSCQLCRKRKIRCNGDPEGCDKCAAVSAECTYPPKGSRRRKNTSNSTKATVDTPESTSVRASRDNSATAESNTKPKVQANGHMPPTGWELHHPLREGDQRFDFALDPEFDFTQDMEHWLNSSSADIMDTEMQDDNLNPMLPTSSALDPSYDSITKDIFGSSESLQSMSDLNNIMGITSVHPSALLGTSGEPHGLPLDSDMSAFLETPPQSRPSTTRTSSTSFSPLFDMNDKAFSTISDARNLRIEDHSEILGSCRCLNRTVSLLEQLGAEDAQITDINIDVMLGQLRGALVHCMKTLDCEQCSVAGELNMLLAMASQYMSLLCERIVMAYIELRQQITHESNKGSHLRPNQSRRSSPASSGTDKSTDRKAKEGPKGAMGDMWFSTYRIETTAERMQVLRCLVTVQLNELSRLLEKLKVRAVSGNRKGQLVPLGKAEKRIKNVRTQLADLWQK